MIINPTKTLNNYRKASAALKAMDIAKSALRYFSDDPVARNALAEISKLEKQL